MKSFITQFLEGHTMRSQTERKRKRAWTLCSAFTRLSKGFGGSLIGEVGEWE